MFKINFKDIALKQKPSFLRVDKLKALLFVFVKPLRTLNDAFLAFREEKNYYLTFNGQIIYLEHLLNDLYDPINRRIYIEDVSNVNELFLYNANELRTPTYFYNDAEGQPLYMRNQPEYVLPFEFKVKYPAGMVFSEIEMRSKIDQYRLAGKRYIIEQI